MNIKRFIVATSILAGLLTTNAAACDYGVPAQSNVHTYMDYGAITNTESNQYKLERFCYTDENGLRCYLDENGNVYYLVALAEYYGTDIGTTYNVTLDNGSSFKIMLGDCKAPEDTDSLYGRSAWNFLEQKYVTNVIEFIVDTDYLPYKVRDWGTLTALDFFNGNVESIEMIGREWTPDSPFIYYC